MGVQAICQIGFSPIFERVRVFNAETPEIGKKDADLDVIIAKAGDDELGKPFNAPGIINEPKSRS